MKDDTIASAARRWDAARIEAEKLKKKRAAFLCERTEKFSAGEGAPIMEPDRAACWRRVVGPFNDGSPDGVEARRLTPDEQCASCRERYAVHLALRAATRRRGANLRAMMTLLAAERKRLGFTDEYERKLSPKEPS
jgi:hypothetical protein